ncbi:DUF2066 domain-containing protein [Kiloniella antarctica]|uniref:DUF2066 domain-containing protein n=1 Tax=Kiloniella antarctica TaxID=1550907 RepID=A0ABW5BSM2_9PROT
MRFRRFFNRTALLVTFFALVGQYSLSPAWSGNHVYTVTNIKIDASAGSATEAKKIALSQGYERAFKALVERLVPQQDHAKVPLLSAKDALNYVLDISLSSERSSSVRYIAKMTVRFKESRTRGYLRNTGVALAELISKPVLVLPIQKSGEQSLLWGESNQWRAAWGSLGETNGLVPLTMPLGDLQDIGTVDAKGALAGKDGLWKLASKYGSNDIFLSIADIANDSNSAELSAVRTGKFGDGRTYRLKVVKTAEESTAGMLERGANSLNGSLQQDWKQANLLQFGIERWILVQVPIEGLQDWVLINNRLQDVPAINRLNTRSINRSQVNLDVYFSGDERQLTLALAQKDLAMLLNENSIWELRLLNKPAASSSLTLPLEEEVPTLSEDFVVDELAVPTQEIDLSNDNESMTTE